MLTTVTISGNTASESGGGIYNDNYSPPTLTNVTISGNTANNCGGGIYNRSPLTLTNVTISGNKANNGGGIYNYTRIVTLQNSIVAGNTASNAPDCWVYSDSYTSINASNSLIGNTAHSSGKDVTLASNCIVNTDPLFADWKNPASVTMPNIAGDYTLKAGSPAIGAGKNEYYPGGITALASATDLAGNPRLFGTNIDMGAYEANVYLATFQFGSPRPDSIVGVAPNGKLIKPADPDSTGYTFGEWYADALYTTPFEFTDNITQDTTLYAKWQAKVTFNPNGSSIAKSDTIVDLNEDVSGWEHVPTLTGYTFGGWFTDNGTFTDEWDIAATLVTQDTTLYAKWQA
jgi:uncharacterized repeat protein (TIGR02543 family)